MGRMSEVSWFEFRQVHDISLFSTASGLYLGPTQSPLKSVPRVLSRIVKRPMPKAEHSFPSTANVMNAICYTVTCPYTFITCTRCNFTCVCVSKWRSPHVNRQICAYINIYPIEIAPTTFALSQFIADLSPANRTNCQSYRTCPTCGFRNSLSPCIVICKD